MELGWGHVMSADRCGNKAPSVLRENTFWHLTHFNWFWRIKVSVCIRGLSCPPLCSLCLSLWVTVFHSTHLANLLDQDYCFWGDLGFLPSQHMLHSYHLRVVRFHVFSAVHRCTHSLSFIRGQPFSELLREEMKKWWQSMKTNCTFEDILLHLFGLWDGRILRRWQCNKQVCWGNNITRLLTNCWYHSEAEDFFFSVGFFYRMLWTKEGK